jgi:hypothetical protein
MVRVEGPVVKLSIAFIIAHTLLPEVTSVSVSPMDKELILLVRVEEQHM